MYIQKFYKCTKTINIFVFFLFLLICEIAQPHDIANLIYFRVNLLQYFWVILQHYHCLALVLLGFFVNKNFIQINLLIGTMLIGTMLIGTILQIPNKQKSSNWDI